MENKHIPKKIHLIWFGEKENFNFDLSSLKMCAPNYEVKVWGEKDFDWEELNKIKYVKNAYNSENWAFLSDYLRVKILFEEGGIYLDSDIELLRNIEEFFIEKELVLAFENTTTLSMGITGAKKGHKFFGDIMKIYESFQGGKNIIGNVIWDLVAKRNFNIKINGKKTETESDDLLVCNFKTFSLLNKTNKISQYALHKHQISWVPKWSRKSLRTLILVSQKIPFVNKIYFLVLLWPKKQMKKNFILK